MLLENSVTVQQTLTEVKKTGDEDEQEPVNKGETEPKTTTDEGEDDDDDENKSCNCPAVLYPSTGGTPPADDADELSPRLTKLLTGANIPGDHGQPPVAPPWLDRELFNEGRKFYKKYLFCLTFSELLSLLLVLAKEVVLKPLIYTRRSDTPGRARRRYVSTLLHLMTWFEGDVWDSSDEAHKDLMAIRTTHRRLGSAFNTSDEHEKVRSATVRGKGHAESPIITSIPSLKQDLPATKDCENVNSATVPSLNQDLPAFKEYEDVNNVTVRGRGHTEPITSIPCPKQDLPASKSKQYENVNNATVRGGRVAEPTTTTTSFVPSLKQDLHAAGIHNQQKSQKKEEEEYPVFISQLDMSFTQYSFMGLILAHPEYLGASAATYRELAGLVHFWRGLGWLLGIHDEFNFCSGTVEETRSLALEVERRILLPSLAASSYDYEQMVHALMAGMAQFLPMLSLPAMLKYLSYIFSIPTPSLSGRMSWRHVLQYWLMRVTFGAILLAPRLLRYLNGWFRDVIGKVVKKDTVNLAAYRKAQAALTLPLQDTKGFVGYRCPMA